MPHTNIYSARPRIQPTFYSDSRSNQKPTNLAVNPILVLKKAADINHSISSCRKMEKCRKMRKMYRKMENAKNVSGLEKCVTKNVSGLAFCLILEYDSFMARPIRIEFAGALYHVTSRGNRKEDIYLDDTDRECFLFLLKQITKDYNWLVHAYCLMDNHYHLLIETPDGNLSKGMRQLNGVYTQKINRYHGNVGHVFQGRYKAILVQKESYLLELARYIVLNPVRARMVKSVKDWPWSSYHQTSGRIRAKDHWITTEWLLSTFSQQFGVAQKKYQEFVAQGKNQPSPWASLQNQVFLGSDDYVSQILNKIDQEKDLSEIPASQRREKPKELSWYEKQTATRNAGIKLSYESGGYSMKEIGKYYKLHYSRVSRIIRMTKDKT